MKMDSKIIVTRGCGVEDWGDIGHQIWKFNYTRKISSKDQLHIITAMFLTPYSILDDYWERFYMFLIQNK